MFEFVLNLLSLIKEIGRGSVTVVADTDKVMNRV